MCISSSFFHCNIFFTRYKSVFSRDFSFCKYLFSLKLSSDCFSTILFTFYSERSSLVGLWVFILMKPSQVTQACFIYSKKIFEENFSSNTCLTHCLCIWHTPIFALFNLFHVFSVLPYCTDVFHKNTRWNSSTLLYQWGWYGYI